MKFHFRISGQLCPGLLRLDVTGSVMTDVALLALAHGCPKLEDLNITCCQDVTPKGLEQLVRRSVPRESRLHPLREWVCVRRHQRRGRCVVGGGAGRGL